MVFGFIYKISNSQDERVYVGSTKDITKRLSWHKTKSINKNDRNYNMPLYVCMREIGRDNFSITHLETFEYDDKKDLLLKEREWIEKLSPSLNQVLPIVSIQETTDRVKKWHTDNKEHVKEYKKQHYLKKKAEIQAKHKTYYEANKEHLKAKAKENAKKNPKTTITCECGGSYLTGQKNRHLKTDKHIDYEKELITPTVKIDPKTSIVCECGGKYIPRMKSRHFKSVRHVKYEKELATDP